MCLVIKFTNQTPPPRGESQPGHDDVRDLGDGPWRKQLGGVNLKKKSFFWEVETRGDSRT